MEYDIIVIGTGAGGSSTAKFFSKKGWKVMIVDNQPFGGTCALRGCNPKKVLVSVMQSKDFFERMKGNSVVGDGYIDWEKMIAFKNTFTKGISANSKKNFKEKGINIVEGTAKFIGKNIIDVDGEIFESKYFLIASGAKPRFLKIPGEELLTRSDDFLNMKNKPKSIIFIGGGYISFEFAHVVARAGIHVKILHRSKKVLKKFDKVLVNKLVESSNELGIDILLEKDVKRIDKKDNFLIAICKDGSSYEAEVIVHGAGRVPNIDELNLEKTGVEFDEKGIFTNEYMQTTSTNIYSAGDCCKEGYPLTPVASMQSKIARHNILNGNSLKIDYSYTPSVVFTEPPLARIGLTTDEAEKNNVKFKLIDKDTSSWKVNRRVGLNYGGFRVLLDDDGKIIGAHVFGFHAEEIINIFAVAMKYSIPLKELKEIPWTSPTGTSTISSL